MYFCPASVLQFRKATLKLTYAIHKKELVHISQVVKGIACNCICPSCKAPLKARKGNIKQHHFAHHNTNDCSGSVETALHLLAKDIILEEKRLKIPELKYYDYELNKMISLTKAQMIKIDAVKLEVSYGNFQPDIVLSVGGKTVFVEIAVTHFVDDEKLDKLIDFGVSTLEIDLSGLNPDFTKESLKKLLIEETNNKWWLFSNQEDSLKRKHKYRLAREEEIYLKKIENENAWYNYKVEMSKYNGYSILETNHNDLIICPKKTQSLLKNIKIKHSIFDKLKKGATWDGEIGRTGGGANFITLDNEICFFSPSWVKQEKASKEVIKGYKRMWAILNGLSNDSIVNPIDCKNCPFFDDYISEPYEVSCKFNKNRSICS